MDDSISDYSSGSTYTSCMRMNGVPLLPPLMTPEYRQEMQYYKKLAISIENRLYEMRMCLDETTMNSNVMRSDSDEWNDNLVTLSSKSNKEYAAKDTLENMDYINRAENEFESLNSLVTVIDNDLESSLNSSLYARDKSSESFENTVTNLSPPQNTRVSENTVDLMKTNSPAKNPIKRQLGNKSRMNLEKKLNQLSLKNVVKTKKAGSDRKENISPNKKAPIKISPSKNATGSLNNISSGLTSPPRLVRQNSYTLEHPSPLLLAHLEEQSLASGVDLHSISMSESTSTNYLSSKRKSWDSNTAKETWSSVSSDINSMSVNDKNDIPTPPKFNTIVGEPAKIISDIPDVLSDCEKSSVDKLMHSSTSESYYKSIGGSNNLDEVLQRFQEEHDACLARLLKKQQEEQLLLKQSFEKKQQLILSKLKSTIDIERNLTNDMFFDAPLCDKETLDIISDDKSKKDRINGEYKILDRSNYDLDEPITERTNNTLDDFNSTFSSIESNSASKLKNAYDRITKIQHNLASKIVHTPMNEKRDYYVNSHDVQNQVISLSSLDSNGHSFNADRNSLTLNLTEIHRPKIDRQSRRTYTLRTYSDRELQAATTIVAHAKGYLTRRLMKTDKVESTVQTIRDALMCALQLHRDEGGIQGADVGLHRRLIQQITAACYSLHDMFIVSTPAERMSIISQDRERKRSITQRSASSSSSRHLSITTQKILKRKLENMSKSHSGVFGSRSRTVQPINHMSRSHHENFQTRSFNEKTRRSISVSSDFSSRKPWR